MIEHPNAQTTGVLNTLGADILAGFRIVTPLLALQLQRNTGRPSGVITTLPQNVTVDISGTASFATGMIEVSWQGVRYAVFDLDFKARAVLESKGRPTND